MIFKLAMTSVQSAYNDYKNLANALSEGVSKETVYEEIMVKEKNRLDLINRIVDDKETTKWNDTIFYNKSTIQIALTFAETWETIFKELLQGNNNLQKIQKMFYDDDRKIYTGMMLTLIALFLFFIDISS